MKRKRMFVVILIIGVCFLLCGAGWFNNIKVAIDTEENIVYKYYTADEIISAFTINAKEAKSQYDDEMVLLSGKVESIGKNGKNIVLSGLATSALPIDCSYGKELRTAAMAYNVGESVALYGQIIIDAIDKDIHLKAKKIVEVPSLIRSNDMYP